MMFEKTDAANADISVLKRTGGLPTRLLLIGLPLTILLGSGIAALLVGGLSLFTLAVLATMLAPTDAALGKAVVTNILSILAHGVTANPWARAYGERRRLGKRNPSGGDPDLLLG